MYGVVYGGCGRFYARLADVYRWMDCDRSGTLAARGWGGDCILQPPPLVLLLFPRADSLRWQLLFSCESCGRGCCVLRDPAKLAGGASLLCNA